MNSLGKTGKPRQEELVDNLCQLTVCQMSEEMGFIGGLRESSLHTLSDVLQRYIQEIGDCAASKATANGRTQVNYFDIEYVLENEMNCSISQLNHFETYSSLLPSFIHDGTENDDELKIDREKRAQKNGTVLMIDDETDDLLSSLYAQSHSKMDNSNKSNKKSKNKSKSINSNGRKNNDHHHNNINDDDTNISSGHSKRHNIKKKQHIPPYCPNYPPALLYKHTEVFYRHTSSHSSGKMNNGSGIADRNLVEIEDNENFDILNDNNDNNNNNDKNKKKKQKKKDKNNKNKKTNDNENDDINMDGSNDIDDDGIGGSGGGIFANETSDVAKTRRVMIRNPSLFQKKESHQQHQHQQQTQLNGNAIPPKKRLRVDASGKSVGTKGGGDGEFQLFDLP